jgi:hypothetical protein
MDLAHGKLGFAHALLLKPVGFMAFQWGFFVMAAGADE